MNKKILTSLCLLLPLTACVHYQTKNAVVNSKQVPKFSQICIQQNDQVDPSKEYLNIINNRFIENGIKTEIYQQQKPKQCKYSLTYNIQQKWDVTSFISQADLYLFDDGLQVHTTRFKVNSTFELDKWSGAKSKLEKLVDDIIQK